MDVLQRREFETADLVAAHPPRVRNANKQVVLDVAAPVGAVHAGRIGYTRWSAMALPEIAGPATPGLATSVPGFFDYLPVGDLEATEWHVNFADPHLFVAYAGGLFAQDEMQVAEHPALASLRQALDAERLPARTVDPTGPTPVLVTGVERRVRVATDPDPAAGRPHGLYGNAFAAASPEAVRAATEPLDPPSITNLIAIAALAGGRGPYRRNEIETTLTTACSGFRAAVLESGRLSTDPRPVVVHTGYWGCGAFGGDRVLMSLVQLIAASLAGVDRLVFHTGSRGGEGPFKQARARFDDLMGRAPLPIDAVLDELEGSGFRWGVSDGN